jgi:hypothetical protein
MVKLPPIPTPPETTNAPVVVLVELVVFVIEMAAVVELPRLVIDCKVLVFHIITSPVLVVIAVSVPAVNFDTDPVDIKELIVADVTI